MADADLSYANMEDVNFGIYPTLYGHLDRVNSIQYSNDGDYIVSGKFFF